MPNIPSGAELPRIFIDNQPSRPELLPRPQTVVPQIVPPTPAGPAAGTAVGIEKRKADRRRQEIPVVTERRQSNRRNGKRKPGEDRRGLHISIKV